MTDFYSVSYEELPPLPIEPISFDLDDCAPDFDIVSSKRRKRRGIGPSTKRRKTGDHSSSDLKSPKTGKGQQPIETAQENDVIQEETEIPLPEERGRYAARVPRGVCEQFLDAQSFVTTCQTEYQTDETVTNSQIKDQYSSFVEAVFAAELDFWQLSSTIFVVNGWSRQMNVGTNNYYHLHMVFANSRKECYCLCPEGKQADHCFYTRFLDDHGGGRFPVDFTMTEETERVILFSRNVEQYETLTYRNIFSIASSTSYESIKSRAIVQHIGQDSGSGKWMCSKDSTMKNCGHILAGKKFFRDRIHLEDCAIDETPDENQDSSDGYMARNVVEDLPAVSYKLIPPALWARIPSDGEDIPLIPTLQKPPELIQLTTSSSCPCSPGQRATYRPADEKKVQRCEVYGLTRMWQVEIEVQKCLLCKSRYIGPDCQELGLFNWNNRVLLSHDLLDDYNSAFVSSETPFVAWATVLSRRYETFQSPSPFLSEKRFRNIWFAYARLLKLDNDMHCSKCGPTPRVTIWDGVTLAFSRKNLTSSLSPPTTIRPTSKIRDKARRPKKPQCIKNKDLRKKMRHVLTGPALRLVTEDDVPVDNACMDDDPSDDDSEEETDSKKAARAVAARRRAMEDMRLRVKQAQDVIKRLEKIDSSLAGLFRRCYGRHALVNGPPASPAYTSLFMQLASEDSVLQLMTRSIMERVKLFADNPNFENASHLTMFPALYKVIMLELSHKSRLGVPKDLLSVCRWIAKRGMTILQSVTSHEDAEKDFGEIASTTSWQKTGCIYSMPQIRQRPVYPAIPKDGMADVGGQAKRGTGCGKYYSQYGQKRLTGGIMAVWCSHSVCYGFHCIPASEGRNEVFSAIYTHWEKAPDIIVYDYACNLAPYIMAREPAFFQNTKCLIDHFHSMGHTACGSACKLMTYVSSNPDLDRINSSAAESGNSGILRIRKLTLRKHEKEKQKFEGSVRK